MRIYFVRELYFKVGFIFGKFVFVKVYKDNSYLQSCKFIIGIINVKKYN